MYLLTADINANKLLRYAKSFILKMPRSERMSFLGKYIIYAIANRDMEAIEEGLGKLLSMNTEYMNSWRAANKSYTEPEGERVDLLYQHAFRKPVKKRR